MLPPGALIRCIFFSTSVMSAALRSCLPFSSLKSHISWSLPYLLNYYYHANDFPYFVTHKSLFYNFTKWWIICIIYMYIFSDSPIKYKGISNKYVYVLPFLYIIYSWFIIFQPWLMIYGLNHLILSQVEKNQT